MSRAIRFAPLALLLIVILALVWRLATPADTTVSSKLEGQPLPVFRLAAAVPPKAALETADFATGQPRILNIFASWCVPCISEVKVLQGLKKRGVHIDGIAIRDRPQDVAAFLDRNGDPYERIGGGPPERVANRARLIGCAQELHRRWGGHHPLSAHRPHRSVRRPEDLKKLEEAR